jgi:hypothetical protein
MSDNRLKIIPENPDYIPAQNQQSKAESAFLEIAPDSDEINSTVSDGIQFHDCGTNFENISCPYCGANLDMDWWKEMMDQNYENGLKLQQNKLPCCGEHATLNELQYDSTQGFAKYSIEALNPNISELDNDQLFWMESILGCKLRVIYQHL